MSLQRKVLLAVVMIGMARVSVAQSATPACDDPQGAKRETVAELRDVQGNVLVSDAQGMASGVENRRLKNRDRVATTARGSVLVRFDCGCEVRLRENERLDVESPRSCAALLAAVTTATPAVAIGAPVATAAATGSYVAPAAIGAAGVGGYLLYRNNRNSSPN